MIADASVGTSFKALAAYLEYGTPDGSQRNRVDWIESRNLPTTHPQAAARIMKATARGSDSVQPPVYHFSVSFHLRGRFRLKVVAGQGEPLVSFRHYAQRVVEMAGEVPTRERLAELQAAAEATAAAEAALGPEPPHVDAWKAPRRAAGPILDAMRLISPRFPEDAAPDVRRQFVAMLPHGAEPLIDRAIQIAQKPDTQRRGGRPTLGRER